MTTTGTKCKFIKADGEQCQAWADASGFCFWHNPAKAQERARARSKGGRARHGRTIGTTGDVDPVSVKNMADVVSLLEKTINDALALENSLQRARTIATLANVLIKALEFATLEERLAAVELALKLRD